MYYMEWNTLVKESSLLLHAYFRPWQVAILVFKFRSPSDILSFMLSMSWNINESSLNVKFTDVASAGTSSPSSSQPHFSFVLVSFNGYVSRVFWIVAVSAIYVRFWLVLLALYISLLYVHLCCPFPSWV